MKWLIFGNKTILMTVITLAGSGAIAMWWFGGGFNMSLGEQIGVPIFGAILGAGVGVLLGVWGLVIADAIAGGPEARVSFGVMMAGAIMGAFLFWSIAGSLAGAMAGMVVGIFSVSQFLSRWDFVNKL